MNAAHIHLMANHMPILGSAFGLLVLLFAMILRTPSQQVRNAAYLILILSAAGALVANGSGEGAEELVERLSGISHDAIEAHEESAPWTVGAAVITGLLALSALVLHMIKPVWNGRIALAVTLAALLTFSASVRTGYLGGKIRHTELDNPAAVSPGDD